jgi:hypothetical protein
MPPIPMILCPEPACGAKAVYVGTQDTLNIYTCEREHLIRLAIDAPRQPWEEKDEGHA